VWLLFLLNLGGKCAAVWIGRVAPGTALALWFGPEFVLAYHVFMPHAQGLVRSARRFATDRREIWLTIDDGPDPTDTPRLLELLAAHGARATFFVIGKKAEAHPELICAIVAGGHEIGHHTYSHPLASFWCASPGRVRREIAEGLAVLRTQGVTPTRFRPPACIKSLWLKAALRAHQLECVGWATRGLERRGSSPEAVAARALRGLAPGNILLLHEGPAVAPTVRVHAIRLVLEHLQRAGYACVVPPAREASLPAALPAAIRVPAECPP
jgi:peptidoglycan-N-acetylglucosamine deacetylase